MSDEENWEQSSLIDDISINSEMTFEIDMNEISVKNNDTVYSALENNENTNDSAFVNNANTNDSAFGNNENTNDTPYGHSKDINGPTPKKTKLSNERNLQRIKCTYHRKLKGRKCYEVRQILDTDVIKFCQELGLIASSVICKCGNPMKFSRRSDLKCTLYIWRCRTSNHYCSCSIRRGTWFEQSRLKISEILWLAYMWLYQYSYNSMCHECNQGSHFITDWLNSCLDLCQAIMEIKSDPLGGEDKVVEVFHCAVDNNKEEWVFTAIEHNSCKTLLIIMQDKESQTLVNLFDKYILPGSIVLTNLWGFMRNITNNDFNYLFNKRSIRFYDDVSKGEMKTFKQMSEIANRSPAINRHTKYKYNLQFCEKIYRKSLMFSDDAYITFLKDVAKVYTPVVKIEE